MDNRAAALKGGDGGVDIIPGDSARSPLIQYVAWLVPDSEMPPPGKGNRLSPTQVALLRAWIDQGAVWIAPGPTNLLNFAFAPEFGATSISGNKYKYRELNWQPGGADGGANHFEVIQQLDADTKLQAKGHALRDDYEVNLTLDRSGLGFIHSGWQQYRKYYDNVGGYDPAFVRVAPSSQEDLYVDIGKAWVEAGITVPNWPMLVLGYEYDYRRGNEATTEWNSVGTNSATARNLGPATRRIHESVQIVKADLTYDHKGWTLEDRFRGEFYHLTTASTNTANGSVPESIREGTSYFQGANTFRLEKKFTAWLYGSAGYLYSKLNADSTFQLNEPTLLQTAVQPDIALTRESNVGNVNALLGPIGGLTLSGGILADDTRQTGLGPGLLDEAVLMPLTNIFVPFAVDSAYDESTIQENLALRYARIPFTSLFAEGRLEQQDIGQFDQFSSSQDILNKAVFTQHTIFASRSSDARFGFDTSPWRMLSASAQYRYTDDDSRYDSSKLIQPIVTGYPTFITHRDLKTDEIETHVMFHPSSFFKATLSYQYHDTEYDVTTRAYEPAHVVISPGGELVAGRERADVYSLGATIAPSARMILNGTLSYQTSTLTTAANRSPAVVPYRGNIVTLLADGTYVLSKTTDLFVACFYSSANYGESDFAKGLPLGIEYQRIGAQAGISRRLGKNAAAKLQYRFDHYHEPSSGGANDYVAHSVYGTLNFQFR